ncbi:RecE family exodeoxyribonuclease, partial [Streptococcus pyogenes]
TTAPDEPQDDKPNAEPSQGEESSEQVNDAASEGEARGIQQDQDASEESDNRTETPELTVVATMPFRHRVLAQFIGD